MGRLAQTLAPDHYPCLALMLPGSPHADSPKPVYFYREQVASWLAQFDDVENAGVSGEGRNTEIA